MDGNEENKDRAAAEAIREVKSGQVIGLGTGSTARFFVERLGQLWRAGRIERITGVPTSEATRAIAEKYGIPLAPPDAHAVIDLAVDGADEIDPRLDLIKGLGGALLREKAVEIRARRFIVIADDTKLVERLGTKAKLPIEVAPDRWEPLAGALESLGAVAALRRSKDGAPKLTDQENYLLDLGFSGGIDDPRRLARALDAMPDVLAHGLFLGMASLAIVGTDSGTRRIERRETA